MKNFTLEGRVECGLDDVVAGKAVALVVVPNTDGWGLGLAIANEAGYIPIPRHWCRADAGEHKEIARHADELNREWFGLEPLAALRIIGSTMKKQNRRRRSAGGKT